MLIRYNKASYDVFGDYGKYKKIKQQILLSKSEISRHSDDIELYLYFRIITTIFPNCEQKCLELVPDFRICLPSKGWTYDDWGMMGNNRCYFFIYIDRQGLLVSCDFLKLVYALFYIEEICCGYYTKKRIFNQYLEFLREDIKKKYPNKKLYKRDFFIYGYEQCDTKLLKCMSLWLQLMSKKKSENNINDVSTTKKLILRRKKWKTELRMESQ